MIKLKEEFGNNIVIIGCGGNGSRLLAKLCNYIVSQNIYPAVYLVDEDVVEEKNISRQMFHIRDIGKPKAKVLAERYGMLSNRSRNFDYYNSYVNDIFSVHLLLNEKLNIYRQTLIFLCVDNNPTRKLFWEYLKGDPNNNEANNSKNWTLIDMGNSKTFGQCVTTMNHNKILYGSDPRILYPNMIDMSIGNMPRVGGSCDSNHVSEPQTLAANERTSQFGYDVFFHLMEYGELLPRCEWAWRHPVGDQLITGMDIDEPITIA
jgi:ThiF family